MGAGRHALHAVLYSAGRGGRLCWLEVLEVSRVMCRVLLCMLEASEGWVLFARGAGGDAICAALYAEGCR